MHYSLTKPLESVFPPPPMGGHGPLGLGPNPPAVEKGSRGTPNGSRFSVEKGGAIRSAEEARRAPPMAPLRGSSLVGFASKFTTSLE